MSINASNNPFACSQASVPGLPSTTPAFELIFLGAGAYANTAGDSTSAVEFAAHVNSVGFTITTGKIAIINITVKRQISGQTVMAKEQYYFKNNNTPGTYGTGSTNGEVAFSDFIFDSQKVITEVSSDTVYIDLGNIEDSTIFAYINGLDPATISWEELLEGKDYIFDCQRSGVKETYRYDGTLPKTVGSGNTPLTVGDFDLIASDVTQSSLVVPPQQSTTNEGDFDGTLNMTNQNAGTKFNPYDIGINGSITFALGGNEVDFGFDWLPVISDGATSFLTNLDFFLIKQGVPEGNVLPSGEGFLLMYNTPNGVGVSYMQKVSEIGVFFEYLFTGNLNDTSGNSNTAFLNGTVALTADRNAVSNAGYLVPSGVTNYIDYNNIIFENGISIAFWVHSISGDLAGTYIICDEDLGVFVGNSPNGNGNIALSRKGFGATPVIDSGVDVAGSHFICLTITDAGAATFYVDDMSTPVGTADLSGATFYGNYKSGAVASSIDIKLDNMYFYGGVINEAKRIELKAQN